MSTKIDSVFSGSNIRLATFALLAMGLSAGVSAAPESDAASTAENVRSSISTHKVRGGRDNPGGKIETVEDHKALITTGKRSATKTRGGQAKLALSGIQSESASFDYWFFDADVVLFNDDDNDGYYHGIDLLFDVDTNFIAADIFAVFYLSYEGGPWNEYAETETFTIFGASSADEYVLVSELMSGYPTGSYDLLIEVFDAFDGAFLTSFGPDETSALSFLALEDFDRDAPIQNVNVVVSHGGGGSVDTWILAAIGLLLIISAITKIWRRRNDALMRIDVPAPCWKDYADTRRHSQQ